MASAWGGRPCEYRDDELDVVGDDRPWLVDVDDLYDLGCGLVKHDHFVPDRPLRAVDCQGEAGNGGLLTTANQGSDLDAGEWVSLRERELGNPGGSRKADMSR